MFVSSTAVVMRRTPCKWRLPPRKRKILEGRKSLILLVELTGIEPVTS